MSVALKPFGNRLFLGLKLRRARRLKEVILACILQETKPIRTDRISLDFYVHIGSSLLILVAGIFVLLGLNSGTLLI